MKACFYYQNSNAPKPNKPNHIGVTAILLNNNNQLLLENRSDSNRWALIGGGLKIDETLEQCLKREVYEETGLIITNYTFIDICDDPTRIVQYPDGNVLRIISVVYKSHIDFDYNLRISTESNELKFFDIDMLNDIDIVETHRHIINSYFNSSYDHKK